MSTRPWFGGLVVVVLGALAGGVLGTNQETPSSSAPTTAVAVEGNWELGPFTTDVQTTMNAAGGQIVVNGGELDGLRITVPEQALADGTPVTVEHAEILGQTWGSVVRPVTPAIRVEIGDGSYADGVLSVSVPVDLAIGQMAMGLFVHDDGALEGMAMLGGDTTTVNVATRHFSNWFLSAFDPNGLPAYIDSGYKVARDSWQFVNKGSSLVPRGICSGMSLTSMWYYIEQFKVVPGTAPLYGRFDYPDGARTSGFGEDDAHAIRFASMVHNDMVWEGPTWRAFYESITKAGTARWNFQAFRYSMLVTGEPQVLVLKESSALASSAHAVIAYAATFGALDAPDGSRSNFSGLYIADPNQPGAMRWLSFDAALDEFMPYPGQINADADTVFFQHVGYAAKSALVDWRLIKQRYQELLAGSIGDVSFPALRMFQDVLDPVTGERSLVATTAPVPEADGRLDLMFSLDPQVPGYKVLVQVMEDGGTTPIAVSDALASDQSGGIAGGPTAQLWPGIAGHTYKLIVWQTVPALKAGQPDRWVWVDALPLVIVPPPPTTTTSAPETIAPTVPPTVAPTVPVLPTSPATTVVAGIPCSSCPPGLAGLDCRLHCEGI